MNDSPSRNGSNGGRDGGGRFAVGNAGGPGNPYARRVARLRSLILESVTDGDLRAILRKMVKRAKHGDTAMIRELLTRWVGRPEGGPDPDLLDEGEAMGEASRHVAQRRADAERPRRAWVPRSRLSRRLRSRSGSTGRTPTLGTLTVGPCDGSDAS